MSVYQECIHLYLSKHSELKVVELAEDLERTESEIERDLNVLADEGKAVKVYDPDLHDYVWSAV